MSKQEEYCPTKIRPLMQMVARMVQKNPDLANNMDALWASLTLSVEGLGKESECFGCGRSMKVSLYEADVLDALLVLGMAKVVQANLAKGMPFTEANKVHIPTLKMPQGVLKRQTKCDYLGFVKQQDAWRYTGYWCLTSWAWKALRGEEVPRAVKYWEGNILGRSKATTTLAQMFATHTAQVDKAIAKRKSVRADYTGHIEAYDPKEWGGYGQDLSTLDNSFGTLSTPYKD